MDRDDKVQALLDRQEIVDCVLRYARGTDRHDTEILESAYHSDAVIDMGPFVGSPADLARWRKVAADAGLKPE